MPQEAKSFGNKRGAVYKDKDHPDKIRESNITAAKGMHLDYNYSDTLLSRSKTREIDLVTISGNFQ